MCVCVCVCLCVCVCECVYACVYIHTYIHTTTCIYRRGPGARPWHLQGQGGHLRLPPSCRLPSVLSCERHSSKFSKICTLLDWRKKRVLVKSLQCHQGGGGPISWRLRSTRKWPALAWPVFSGNNTQVSILFVGLFWLLFVGLFWLLFVGLFWLLFVGLFWLLFVGLFWLLFVSFGLHVARTQWKKYTGQLPP